MWAAEEGRREQTGELNGKKIKQEPKRRHEEHLRNERKNVALGLYSPATRLSSKNEWFVRPSAVVSVRVLFDPLSGGVQFPGRDPFRLRCLHRPHSNHLKYTVQETVACSCWVIVRAVCVCVCV